MQRRFGTQVLALFLVLLAVVSGCEKKRKSRYVQGDGEHVYELSQWKGETFTLKTHKKRTPGVTTRADELYVNPGSNIIRSFDSVDFEMEASDLGEFSSDTLNNFDFYGKEDSEYKVQVDFTENHMVFFKLATKDELPTNEVTYAENIGNEMYRVPLFGLPLNKYTIERIKDDRDKSTNRIATFSKKFLAESTHFSVVKDSPAYFESQLKLDMLPSSFFDEKNEWFYEVTVVDKPIALGSGEELGMQMGSGKVRFGKTNNSILAVDLNIADEAQGQDAEKLSVIFEIPVDWMDYRLVKTGSNAYLKEEAFDDIEKGAKFWKDRQYALLQLDRVLSIDAASTQNIKIKRLEVADDYFSFIIYDSLTKMSQHFSFARSNAVGEAKVYPREDMRRFGFFATMKSLYSGELNESETAISRSLIQNRMMPVNNEIIFHITENTPTDPLYMEAIQTAVDGWDRAFAKAAKGTKYEANPIRVKLDLSKPVKNGDARYHKVSFYGYEIESGLLGYGPSVSDSRNGEVFSSTNHIYLRNYRESIIRNLVNYVRYKVGAYNGLGVDGVTVPDQVLAIASNDGFNFNNSAVASSGGINSMYAAFPGQAPNEAMPATKLEVLKSVKVDDIVKQAKSRASQKLAEKIEVADPSGTLFKEFISLRRKFEQGTINESQFNKEMRTARSSVKTNGSNCEMLAATSLTFKEIEDVCGASGTEFSDYVADLQGRVSAGEDIYRLDSEREVLLNCAQKLMKPTLIATLAHEFGHNFGLRHNFQGSADWDNFERDANGKPVSRMASVMDYSHGDADRGVEPAPYDVAAIRYGYYNHVEIQNKSTGERSILDINTTANDLRPIERRVADLKGSDYEPRPFAYCTDGDIAGYPYAQVGTETPFCERWDQGSDPVTKMRSSIDTLVTSAITNGNRFDMEGLYSSAGLAASAIGRSMGGMKNLYDMYRFMLYNSSKVKSAQLGQLKDDPYFDTASAANGDPEAETERQVLGAEYDKAIAVYNKVSANNLSIDEVEKEVHSLTKIAQYKVASEIYKKFMLEIVFLESNYCVALRSNGNGYEFLDAEPLSTVRPKNFYLTQTDSPRCEDTAQYFTNKLSTSQNTTVSVDKVVSVGNPFDNVGFSSNPEVLSLRTDVRTGLAGIRSLALGYLAARTAMGTMQFQNLVGPDIARDIQYGLTVAALQEFLPSVFDGASFRNAYMAKLKERFVRGVEVSRLVSFADAKVKSTEATKTVTASTTLATRALPFFQEEKDFLANAWYTYRLGVQSPRAVDSAKTQDTQFVSLPYDNFIGFQGNTRYGEYVVSSDNVAYFTTTNNTARSLIRAFNETNDALLAVDQKKSILSNASTSTTRIASFENKVTSVVSGYYVALKKMNDRYQNLNDVMYQVRICVLNDLTKEFGLNQANFSSLLEQRGQNARFSISKYCEAPRGDAEAEMAAFEAQFASQARALLNYIREDKKILTASNVENILDSLGLPYQPNQAEDPKTTLETIFKSQSTIGLSFVGYDFASTGLSSLEYQTILRAISKLDTGLTAAPAADGSIVVPSITEAVQAARIEIFNELAADEPYVTHLNDKREMMRNVIFSGI